MGKAPKWIVRKYVSEADFEMALNESDGYVLHSFAINVVEHITAVFVYDARRASQEPK